MNHEDCVKLAIAKFKELHWKPIKCSQCHTTKNVKEVEIWCDPYCEECLDKALKADEDDLFDSVDETPEYNY